MLVTISGNPKIDVVSLDKDRTVGGGNTQRKRFDLGL